MASQYIRCARGADGLEGMTKKQLIMFLNHHGYYIRGCRQDIIESVRELKCDLNLSIGELMCTVALLQLGIDYIPEFECDIPEPRRYDFGIPRLNAVIEYHGEPHFCLAYRNQGRKGLNECRHVDVRKARYALNRKWKVIILDMECRSIDSVIAHIRNGLNGRERLYLSDEHRLRYIRTGLARM